MNFKNIIFSLLLLAFFTNSYAYDFEKNGFYYNILSMKDKTVEITHGDNQYSGDIIIPDSVIYSGRSLKVIGIGEKAFDYCYDVQSVKFSKNIESIGDESFRSVGIKQLIIPNTIEYIGGLAFSGCSDLKELIIEDGSNEIEINWDDYLDRPFKESAINKIYLGRNVKRKSYGFQSSVFEGLYSDSLNVTIGSQVTYLTYLLFKGCKIKHIILPNTVKNIYSGAFENCKLLENIELGNSLEEIGIEAFKGCSKLPAITLPESVKSIGDGAFADCSKLLSVTSKIKKVFDLTDNCFATTTYWTGTLFVPEGMEDIYRRAKGWSIFDSIKEQTNGGMGTYYDLNIEVSAGGNVVIYNDTITSGVKSYSLKEKKQVSLDVKPFDGYTLKSFLINGKEFVSDVNDCNYTIPSLNENINIKVSFVENPILLTIKNAASGSISQEVSRNDSFVFIINANEGWRLESVSFNGVEVTDKMIGDEYETPKILYDSELSIVYKEDKNSGFKSVYSNLKVLGSKDAVIIQNNGYSTKAYIYGLNGQLIRIHEIINGVNRIELPKNHNYIIKIEDQSYKVLL